MSFTQMVRAAQVVEFHNKLLKYNSTYRYLFNKYDTQCYWVHYFVQKNKKKYFEEINGKVWCVFDFFRLKDIDCHMYKVTNAVSICA